MKLRHITTLAALALPTAASAQTAAFDSAYYAWNAGDYPAALETLEQILRSGPHVELRAAIAELTGEWHVSTEVSNDGRAVRWSPDSRHFRYETGAGTTRRSHVVRVEADGSLTPVATVDGHGLQFSSDGALYAWLRVADNQELSALRTAVSQAESSAAARAAREALAQAETRATTLQASSFSDGGTIRSAPVPPGGVAMVAAAHAGLDLYQFGIDDNGGAAVFRTREQAPERMAALPALPRTVTSLPGRMLLDFGNSFGLLDTQRGDLRTWEGSQAASSADGSVIAYVTESGGGDATLNVLRNGAAPEVLLEAARIAAPAVSVDGSTIVFQHMPREDWELYTIGLSGDAQPRRITHEVQHDLFPKFLPDGRILAVIGEARHRRAHLHDPRSGQRLRLFHNNTIRTVAPEYEWELSPDGTRLLIVAERDGDTISPERGVYLLDLTRTVSSDALSARIDSMKAAESSLRARGAELFAPIAQEVARVTGEVTTGRIYSHARDLFAFGSKYITQPGNALATEYIAEQLRSFGYEPELQWFEPRAGIRTANVIATLPGTVHPDVTYVVSSHFDSVERGPGADDNSSGTTALLEAARVLADDAQPATIKFAFFTGEEAGLLGSREFVRRAVAASELIVGALNNDMVGYVNDNRLDNTIRYSNAGIRDIQHAAALQFTDLITYDAKYYKNTDAHAYYDAYGDIVGGIGSYPILGNPHYHQAHDHLETINQQLVAEVSKTTAATLMLLASSPSRVKDLVVRRGSPGSVVAIWSALPESDIAAYVVEWGPPGGDARGSVRVTDTQAAVRGVAGDEVRVRGVNTGGLVSWDAAVARIR